MHILYAEYIFHTHNIQYYVYSLLNDDLSAAKSLFSTEYYFSAPKKAYSLLNIDFSIEY